MSTSNKYICIHGHFYQPPRENAWLEAVEKQDSAAPFHDWNERINFECYAPNTAARILDKDDVIVGIVNNYARISFNLAPRCYPGWKKRTRRPTRAFWRQIRKASNYLADTVRPWHRCTATSFYLCATGAIRKHR